MKKLILILVITFSVSIVFTSCSGGSQKKVETTEQTAFYYTCEMDPDVKTNQPGKCPKCGCELIKKDGELKQEELKQDTTKK